MVEKVGHSKRMQITRKAWLDDTKSSRRALSPDPQTAGAERAADRENSIFGDLDTTAAPASRDQPGEDELDALMGESGTNSAMGQQRNESFGGDEPDGDELDALLAENAPSRPVASAAQTIARRGPFEQDSDDEDELDALMAEQATSNVRGTNAELRPAIDSAPNDSNNDFADEEEVMASMGW